MAGAVAFVGDGLSIEAAADLSGQQFNFIKLDAAGKAVVATAATENLVGVLQNKPISGKTASVKVIGGSKLEVDGSGTAINEGDFLTSDASARGVVAVATNRIRALALEASSAAGDIISVLLIGPSQLN